MSKSESTTEKVKKGYLRKTLGEWMDIAGALRSMVRKDVPIRTSFKMARFLNNLQKEVDLSEEKRLELIKKFGVEDSETREWSVPKNKIPDFSEAYKELISTTIDLEFAPMLLSELGDIKVAPAEMATLVDLFKEE